MGQWEKGKLQLWKPHDFCYRSCYCTQAAQGKMWLRFSQKERQSSFTKSVLFNIRATIPTCKFLLLWLKDRQVSLFCCFHISEMLSCNFEIDIFLFDVPSQLFLPETINESAQKSLGKSSFQCNFLISVDSRAWSHFPHTFTDLSVFVQDMNFA